jgi:hypothetical protein
MQPLDAGPRTRRGAFWVIATAIAMVMFGSAAPAPLYPVYQPVWCMVRITCRPSRLGARNGGICPSAAVICSGLASL